MSETLYARRYGNPSDVVAPGTPRAPGMGKEGAKGPQAKKISVVKANNYASDVSTVAKVAAPGNKYRKRLFIQNRGTQNIFVQFGAIPTNSPTFPSAVLIPPNGFREWEIHCPIDDMYAIVAAGVTNQLLSIEEGIEHVVDA